jgi:hypothetical protein
VWFVRKIAAAFVLAAAVSIFAPTAHADKELDANAGVFKIVHVDHSVLVTYDCPSGGHRREVLDLQRDNRFPPHPVKLCFRSGVGEGGRT